MPGILRVLGTIDLDQFWPKGESDADTSKIKVNVGGDSFSFAADGKSFRKTNAYVGAFARGASSKQVIDVQGRITVRLQGIDAPELHYRAAPLKAKPNISAAKRERFNQENKVFRRQHWGETATVALAKKLARYGSPIRCQVTSFIDHPFEVIDTYGRFVANIRVGPRYDTDINLWLAAEGWAYPTFYSSMAADEIKAYLDILGKARRRGRIWNDYSTDTSKFDTKLLFRRDGPIEPRQDPGKLLMPKIFRRQVSYRLQKKVGVVDGSFSDYLKSNNDPCFSTDEFMKQGEHTAPVRAMSDFMKGTKFTAEPHEIVFREKFSSLVDKNGKKIEKF